MVRSRRPDAFPAQSVGALTEALVQELTQNFDNLAPYMASKRIEWGTLGRNAEEAAVRIYTQPESVNRAEDLQVIQDGYRNRAAVGITMRVFNRAKRDLESRVQDSAQVSEELFDAALRENMRKVLDWVFDKWKARDRKVCTKQFASERAAVFIKEMLACAYASAGWDIKDAQHAIDHILIKPKNNKYEVIVPCDIMAVIAENEGLSLKSFRQERG